MQLCIWFKWAMRQLSSNEMESLRCFHLARGPHRMATLCAGTDCPVMVVRAFEEAADATLGPSSERIRHTFSCEIKKEKQDFLKEFVLKSIGAHRPAIFEDVTELPSKYAHNLCTGQIEAVDDTEDLWAGFPCQDVSRLRAQTLRKDASKFIHKY